MHEVCPAGFEFTDGERRVLDKYVVRHAEPEAGYAEQLTARYGAVVVAALSAEPPTLLERWTAALVEKPTWSGHRSPEEVPCLLIAVVNARRDASEEVIEANEELFQVWREHAVWRRVLVPPSTPALAERVPAAAELLEVPSRVGPVFHVLLLDSSSCDRRFPLGQGVGLARRMGCDLAVALARRGHVVSRYIGSIDGDVHLPANYLSALHRKPEVGALLFPFEHFGSEEDSVLRATELVELSWRYYVLGLNWAGSPFAYHSIGSCLAVEVAAYAQIRGFPRREAGEDFHLLAKVVKLGQIESLAGPVMRIEARRSGRVPFGTGPAVARVLSAAEAGPKLFAPATSPAFTLQDPRVFLALRLLLDALRKLAWGSEALASEVFAPEALAAARELPDPVRETLRGQWERWRRRLAPHLDSCPTAGHRLHRVFEGFDPLATLRALHAFRDAGLDPVPWRQAALEAPFLAAPLEMGRREVLARAKRLEAGLPARRGLESPRRPALQVPRPAGPGRL